MEIWFAIIVTACVAALLNALLSLKPKSNTTLPPGPKGLPLISTIKWLRMPTTEIEAFLRTICSKFGPIVTVHIASVPFIFIRSRTLAYEALIQNGAVFADRPKALPTAKILTSNQHNITSGRYGPIWRTLRRNLTSQILHPSRANDFSNGRKWVLDNLLTHLRASAACHESVKVVHHFHFAMFGLLVYMCFGEKLKETEIKAIEELQLRYLTSLTSFQILNFCPPVTKILLCARWNDLFNLRNEQETILIPLIRARKHLQQQGKDFLSETTTNIITSYVDTLLTLEVSESGGEKRKLTEQELVSACSEFFNAGTDSTATALQWIMANLVKYPTIQSKLFEEIISVIGVDAEEVTEQDLSKMAYLKAVVLEGLRRHPPAHFLLPHAVTQDTELAGFRVPKNAVVNFTVAEMGRDPDVWEDPMLFKPERFMTSQEDFDITGSKEIKMMPFGAGRRMCPGVHLAMLHLEYFVANLVWSFEWAGADGYEVDLSEKDEFTTVMKFPLLVQISPRQCK